MLAVTNKGANMIIARLILLIILSITLSGCFFILVPVGAISNAINGKSYCVSPTAKVGAKVKLNDKVGTITEIQGPVSRCPNALLPIGAKVAFDE